jgi:hypothetical protein
MNYETDEEVVRRVMADKSATPTEKELALRVSRLIVSHDAMEDVMLGFKDEEGRVH